MARSVIFEERVILAAQFGRQRALHYLLERWELPKNQHVTALARQFGLRPQDAADARQEAVFWLMDAIAKFKFTGPTRFRRHRLYAYLRVTLHRRMLNFARGVRRRSRLAMSCRDSTHPLGQAIEHRIIEQGRALDPELLCASKELEETARKRIAAVSKQCEQLYDLLQNGNSMQSAAEKLHVSFHQVRKLRGRIGLALGRTYKAH